MHPTSRLFAGSILTMPWLNVVLFLYGLLNVGMGAMGYFEKGSVISLISGGTAGLLVLGSILYARKNPRAARIAALVVTVLLMGVLRPRLSLRTSSTQTESSLSPHSLRSCALVWVTCSACETRKRESPTLSPGPNWFKRDAQLDLAALFNSGSPSPTLGKASS